MADAPFTLYEYRAIVSGVVDGDTVDLLVDLGFRMGSSPENPWRFRLTGIDAPEMSGEGGGAARDHLMGLLPVGTRVYIRTDVDKKGKERRTFDRYIATIYREGESVSVNDRMVEDGHAVRSSG